MHPHLTKLLALAALLALLGPSACDNRNAYVPPPAAKVTVAKPTVKNVTEYVEFTGNTQAVQSVNLQARVEGYLQDIKFEDGQLVKKGDLLFVIEPEPYKAKVLQAQAQVDSAKAALSQAEIEYKRAKNLYAEKAGPDTDVVKWQTTRDSDVAQLESAKAQLEQAKINYSYTHVTAPFNGRMGRHMVDKGNLVGATEKTQLSTIMQDDPLYAYFTLNERDLLHVIKAHEDMGMAPERRDVPLELGVSNQNDFPHKGKLDYSDLGVDPNTGTMLLRGIFPNPKYVLVPGLFVRLRAPLPERKAVLVPETAVGVDQQGHYVLVVNDKNVVEKRVVTVGSTVEGGMRIVDKGLTGEERVVVNGIQRARPGSQVTAEEAPAGATKS